MSATVSEPRAGSWLRLGRAPHQVITNTDGVPYLHRWYLIPPNRRLNVYLHRFVGSDDPTVLHDHPWWFGSVILAGRYIGITEDRVRTRRRGGVAVHRPTHRHRVLLTRDRRGRPRPCLTVIMTGPHVRDWGFWCFPRGADPARFIPWRQITDRGCDD